MVNNLDLIKPFNTQIFKDLGYNMDIDKDNPTNLYIP